MCATSTPPTWKRQCARQWRDRERRHEIHPLQEAIAWMKKAPAPQDDGSGEVEIRQIFGGEDFGDAMTQQRREQEERVRAQLATG
jgi:hypothetical protein